MAMKTHHYARLQKRDPERNQYRYYLLDVQPHLFGGWSLICEWGRIGSNHVKFSVTYMAS